MSETSEMMPTFGPNTTVIRASDLNRIQHGLIPERERQSDHLRLKKQFLKEQSAERVKNWGNTIDGQRRLKENRLKEKFDKEEAERVKLDEKEAQIAYAARKEQIVRANKLLYEQDDKVKALHGALLLSDVMKEREMQLEIKRRKKAFDKMLAEREHDDLMARLDEAERKEDEKEELMWQKAQENAKIQREQLAESRRLYAVKKEAEFKEGQIIMEQAKAAIQEEIQKEQMRRDRAKQAVADTQKANEQLEKLRAQQKEMETLEEERIKAYSKWKEETEAARKKEAADKHNEKQRLRQAMIDHQYELLMQMKNTEAERLDNEVREAEEKSDALAAAKAERRRREQESINRSRQLQLAAKREAEMRKRMDNEEFRRQWEERNRELTEEEEQEKREYHERELKLQSYLQRQMDEITRQKEVEKSIDAEEAALAEAALKENQARFQQYSSHLMNEWALEGKSLLPIQQVVKKLGKTSLRAD
jgi:hypothetical protein